MLGSYGAYLWTAIAEHINAGVPWLVVGYVAGLLSMLAIRG